MSINSVALYSVELTAGGNDFTQHLQRVDLITKRTNNIPIFQIAIRLNREQYDRYLKPNRDKLVIRLKSYRGMDRDSALEFDKPIILSKLTVLYEVSDEPTIFGSADNLSPMIERILVCVPLLEYNNLQKFVKNKVYLDKTRQEIMRDILDGVKYEILTNEFKGGDIEQVIIPPTRLVGAIQYLHHRWKFFEGGEPIFTYYSPINHTLYMGSCNRTESSKLKYVTIYVGSEHDFIGNDKGSIPETALIANKSIGGKNSKGAYSILKPIREIPLYTTMAGTVGRKQSYCYNPIDNLYSRVVMDLKDMDETSFIYNKNGTQDKVLEHIKVTNTKETWYNEHNGMLTVDNDKENQVFSDHYCGKYINQAFELQFTVEGNIILDDFLYPGRMIYLKCDKNSLRLEGKYYLEESVLSFSYQGMYWACTNNITVKTGVAVSKL